MNQPINLAPMIKGLTPGLPEIGKIKIGMKGDKRRSKSGSDYQLPVRVDHFIITTLERGEDGNFIRDAQAHKKFGPEPKELPVRLLFDEPSLSFQCRWACFTGTQLWCTGDGENALRKTRSGATEIVPCPCERSRPDFQADQYRCKPSGVLSVMLEDMERVGGVYKFRTTSYNSVTNLMSSLALINRIAGGAIAGIPLQLSIRPKSVVTPTDNRAQTVYVVGVEYKGTIQALADSGYKTALETAQHRQRIELIEQNLLTQIPNVIIAENETQEDIAEEFYPESVTAAGPAPATPRTFEGHRQADNGPPEGVKLSGEPEGTNGNPRLEKLAGRVEAIGRELLKDAEEFIRLTAENYKTNPEDIIEQALINTTGFMVAYDRWSEAKNGTNQKPAADEIPRDPATGEPLDDHKLVPKKKPQEPEPEAKDLEIPEGWQHQTQEPEPDKPRTHAEVAPPTKPQEPKPEAKDDPRKSDLYQKFDPINEPLQNRYAAPKILKLKDELDKRGAKYAKSAAGADLHGLLLSLHNQEQQAQADKDADPEPQEAPGFRQVRNNGNPQMLFDPAFLETDEFNELMMLQERYPHYYRDVMTGRTIKTIEDIREAISKIDSLVDRLEGQKGIPEN